MEKKPVVVLVATAVVCILCCMFTFGCSYENKPNDELQNLGKEYTAEEIKSHEQAENAAADYMKELSNKEPYNIMLLNYSPEKYYFSGELKDEAGNKLYEVIGKYTCSFSCDMKNSFLDVELEQKFLMRQAEDGTWENVAKDTKQQKVNVLKSSAENTKNFVRTLEESKYIACISKSDTEGKNVRQIGQSLLYDFMFNLMDQTSEHRTFMPVAMKEQVKNLHQIEERKKIEFDLSDAGRIWESDGGIYGKYIGYIEGLGYSGPLFADDWKNEEECRLSQSNFLIIEKEDGYYLQWE